MNHASSSREGFFKRAFTLIELLVVISIIGLLSSIVLAALSNARSSASVAGGLEFSSYNYHALGANALLYWNFNETPTNNANALDQSGNNYTGTIDGTAARSTNTPNGAGESLTLSGATTNAVRVAFSPALATPPAYTVSVWVYPTSGAGSPVIVRSYGSSCTYGDCIALFLVPGAGAFTAIDYSPPYNGSGGWVSANQTVPLNKWTNIAYSYRACSDTPADGCSWLYVNGALVQTVTSSAGHPFLSGTMPGLSVGAYDVGSYSTTGSYGANFTGQIDDFVIYSQSLAANDIQKLYAEGKAAHPELAIKD